MRMNNRNKGFTLIETVIAIAVVAFGITGMMFAMAAGTRVNEYSSELEDATYLLEQVGVIIDDTEFDSLPALDGDVYNAIDSNGNTIAGLENFTQSVTVTQVNPLTMAVDTNATAPAYLITVIVSEAGQQLTTVQWLKVRK